MTAARPAHATALRGAADRAALAPLVTRRYGEGCSLTDLAAEIGRSFGFVRRVLLDAGVTLRPRGGHHPGPAPSRL